MDQRNGGRRLGAISVSEAKVARLAGANTSQKGNYSNFRNEKLGYTPVDVTGKVLHSVSIFRSWGVVGNLGEVLDGLEVNVAEP